jgi:bacteriocin-like protein
MKNLDKFELAEISGGVQSLAYAIGYALGEDVAAGVNEVESDYNYLSNLKWHLMNHAFGGE